MAKVIIEIEDTGRTTKSGEFLFVKVLCDPPIGPDNLDEQGKLDPTKCTNAQFLGNEIGNLIQRRQFQSNAGEL
ncbi:MAG TPA: hypothetical protein VJ044_11730 [Candidatus Hodarchaeales archaeon]|nr:hypothetical protein [Candidatus Hodarchaeales archaeon]